jgi:hypothetical protein
MEVMMIVLKDSQDKVLGALQAVASIIERRHTLPILVEVFSNHSKSLAAIFNAGPENRRFPRLLPLRRKPAPKPNNGHSIVARARALAGFFSPAKVNARNAP